MTGNAGGKGIFRIGYASACKKMMRCCPYSRLSPSTLTFDEPGLCFCSAGVPKEIFPPALPVM